MRKLSCEIERFVCGKYKTGCGAIEISKLAGIGKNSVFNILRRKGVKVRPKKSPRVYSVNESAFDVLTEEGMYWIGFLLADGCICTRKDGSSILQLSLQKSDVKQVEKFKKFLAATHPLYFVRNQVILAISSKRLCNKLAEYNIVPRKSKTAVPCEKLMNERYFWRGVVDGDGWVSANGSPCVGVVGSKAVCEAFCGFVKTVAKTKAGITKHKSIFKFQATGKTSLTVMRKLYDGSISLERKSLLANNWLLQNAGK